MTRWPGATPWTAISTTWRSATAASTAVLVWATYPNMGIDDRNQLDMVASMPGGIDGVRQMVADFHRRGVRVLFPMMMWDQGTRKPDAALARCHRRSCMKQIDADGINGDTQDGVPLGFSSGRGKDRPSAGL